MYTNITSAGFRCFGLRLFASRSLCMYLFFLGDSPWIPPVTSKVKSLTGVIIFYHQSEPRDATTIKFFAYFCTSY